MRIQKVQEYLKWAAGEETKAKANVEILGKIRKRWATLQNMQESGAERHGRGKCLAIRSQIKSMKEAGER